MSYCRWSDDDFQSDLYVYESDSGFELWVASNRHEFDRSALPPRVPLSDEGDAAAWVARYQAVMDAVRSAKLIPIGLPHDGHAQTFSDAGACADFVELLIAEGYHVPDGVVEALREDDEP